MNDLLTYNKPASAWEEAIPLGNGRIGAMVFGKCDREIISLNEDTLWSGYPKDHNREGAYKYFQKARELTLQEQSIKAQEILLEGFLSEWSEGYLPLGDILIDFSHDADKISDYKRELDIKKAVSSVSYTYNEVKYKREMLISAPQQVMLIKLTADKCGAVSFKLSMDSQLRVSKCVVDNKYVVDGICPSECPPCYVKDREIVYETDDAKKGIQFRCVTDVLTTGGSVTISDEGIEVLDADEAFIYFVVRTSFNGFDKLPYLEGKEYKNAALENLEDAKSISYDDLLKRHTEDYFSYYNRCSFDLCTQKTDLATDERLRNPDKGMFELIFNFGRYLLISSSREGTVATNLQGIWNNKLRAPWSSNYTLNINTEMNYWPALKCGLEEFCEPLDNLAYKLSQNGQKTAKQYYNAKGFVSHHNSDLWGMTNPVGINTGTYDCVYSYWQFSSGWLCRHLYEKYLFTEDINYLKDFAYPIMKSAAEFYNELLVEVDGGLVFAMATSPEQGFYLNGEGVVLSKYTTMSQSIIYELFTNCVAACDILGCDEEFKNELKEKLEKLIVFKVGPEGELLEWNEAYEPADRHHRHMSHMYGLYPGQLITDDTPELMDACRRTMEIRGDDGTGWSLSWKISLWARLKNAKKALELLKRQLTYVEAGDKIVMTGGGTYANMFDAHPPFQIDGNFGVVAGICEMLMLYKNGEITLLPATPDEWKDGSFKGLRAPGQIEVDAEWKNGKIVSYTVKKQGKVLIDDKTEHEFGYKFRV